eukprot:7845848-Pyramimonas_sp.AAC.1
MEDNPTEPKLNHGTKTQPWNRFARRSCNGTILRDNIQWNRSARTALHAHAIEHARRNAI